MESGNEVTLKFYQIFTLFVLLVLCGGAGTARSTDLDGLLAEALANHPELKASAERWVLALYRQEHVPQAAAAEASALSAYRVGQKCSFKRRVWVTDRGQRRQPETFFLEGRPLFS